MRVDSLDIALKERDGALWVVLRGPFYTEQGASLREKLVDLIADGARNIVLDMEEVTILDAPVVSMFLGLENHIRGKSGKIEFVFRNDVVSKAFAPYRNIFSISADRSLIGQGGLLGWLKRRGKMARRRTGVRMSRPVAWFVLCVACGWIFSLAIILFYQNRRIHQQQQIITELTIQKNTATREITTLRNHLRPMVQLGIVRDSLAVQR